MPFEVLIEDDRWTALNLRPLAHRVFDTTLACLGLSSDDCEAALLACDDAHIAVLNADFRGKPVSTNVLSWPSAELAGDDGDLPKPPSPDITGDIALGDIAISYDICAREAEESGKTLSDHTAHLIVHGLLHLLGYDHVRDRDATLMEETERRILGKMGIDDPY